MSAPHFEFALGVVRRLAGHGHRAVFAGGCVRDRLMGREPKDYDVATSALPDEVLALFPGAVPVGAAFGVVRVLGPVSAAGAPPQQVEVATFRTEAAYSDGRHPDAVKFAGPEEDVRRRDFTVNGLLYDPLRDEVLDYVGGQADLQARVLRAIGAPAERFREDRLRLLRAVRFAAALDFEIEARTFEALRAEAPHATAVSAERIRDELARMLSGPNPRRAFELLKAAGLLAYVLPEVDALAGVEQPPEFHPEGDVWTHTLLLLGQLRDAPLPLALGALLHDIGKPATLTRTDRIRFNQHEEVGAGMAEALLRRLRFSNDVTTRVVELVRCHMSFKDARQMRPATLKRFLRLPHFDAHLELHRLDCLACHQNLDLHAFCLEQLGALGQEALRPAPLLNGADLKALGLSPGPLFGKILADVEERQLDGALTSREEALAHVRAAYLDARAPDAPRE